MDNKIMYPFDSVDHEALWKMSQGWGTLPFILLFRDLHTGTTARVRTPHLGSRWV